LGKNLEAAKGVCIDFYGIEPVNNALETLKAGSEPQCPSKDFPDMNVHNEVLKAWDEMLIFSSVLARWGG